MLSLSEMIFGMVGLLVLLTGGIVVFGLRMLSKMRSTSSQPKTDSEDQKGQNP